ncbi:U-box domain-containing protein 4 [Cryptomeria japonica]|uniref:U-box domain-containing protein 4 n=1 Tax=Cryptomeria japonica TaxID=3369 RepID=UPI0027DA9928|nr:U-box domain-containing protein 4 [Cryptomeria japonica]
MPMETLQQLLSNMSLSIQLLSSLGEKARSNRSNCHNLVSLLKLLKPLCDDLGKSNIVMTGQVTRALEALDAALIKARDLVERCGPKGSKIYMVLHSEQFQPKFEGISLKISSILNTLPFASLHLSDHTKSQVEHCAQELKRVKYARESCDEQIAADIENVLRDRREGHKVDNEKLKMIAEELELISNQDVLKEASCLEKEKEYARTDKDKQEEEYINQIIDLVKQLCDYMIELKQAQTEAGVPIPADFRCPLSLELMSDPVIVASGQTYERVYIQQWLDQGMTTCPKTLQTLSHKNLIPNYTVKALIANWCESNNVPLPEPAKLLINVSPRNQTQNIDSDSGFLPTTNSFMVKSSDTEASCQKEISSEEFDLEKENSGFLSRFTPEQGETSTHRSSLFNGEHQIQVSEEISNHVSDQIQGHSRNVSLSSTASSLDDGQTSAGGDAPVSEGNTALSDCSPYSSDVSGELATPLSNARSHRSDIGTSRLSERVFPGGHIPNLWGRRTEDRTTVPSISSSTLADSDGDVSSIRLQVEKLVEDLQSDSFEIQREAAGELRLLAKYNMENRITIANCGATRHLVRLLSSLDSKTQENAVTALLNLSINDNNKTEIAAAGAIEPLINVLRGGNPEAKENAAATLFSLSVMEENKIAIGQSGAIPPLVDLLMNGTPRGKKDAATALFNLSILHENKGRIVRAGAVKHLIELMNPAAGMVDKAVAVLANLSTIQEGRAAIGEEHGISALVEVVEIGSQRGKENAAAALLQLCTNSNKFRALVLQEGAIPPLVALSQSGTPRAKEKAQALLRHFRDQRHAGLGRGADRHMDRHFDRM